MTYNQRIKRSAKMYILSRWDYMGKLDAIKEIKKLFPEISIKDCIEIYNEAYSDNN